ncbi:3-oxo-5-alpha-steroid 4-dehydrogenase-domain-containing protein [Infundibulicybe gibba]|nr:3-oxo-5-alpha-steroid 4-dehydrogenase-domain-containing protein [Infundibulicybe gibba]
MRTIKITTASSPPPFARGFPLTAEFDEDATVGDVKRVINAKFPKFEIVRQKLSLYDSKAALQDDVKLSTLPPVDLQVKDLGPQASWRTVFMVEYGGPLVIHPLFYYYPKLFYGRDVQHSAVQKLTFAFVMLHFLKRELETIFVHRFSHSTMPFSFIFRNSAHYHILSGLFLAFDVYRPSFSTTSGRIVGTFRNEDWFLWSCTALWVFFELSNFHTHLTLRSLRTPGSRERNIPKGYGFTYSSFPNYLFEGLGWLVVCVLTGSIAAYIFSAVAIGTMALWASKKHRNYKKEFGKAYPKSRAAMIPFIW